MAKNVRIPAGYHDITQEIVVDVVAGTVKTWDARLGNTEGVVGSYLRGFLTEEVAEGGRYIIRNYRLPVIEPGTSEEQVDKILKALFISLTQFAPTVAYLNKDGGFIAIRVEDENGKARGWLDFHTLNIGMEAKIMKRLGMLGTQSYMFLSTGIKWVDADDNTYYEPSDEYITIKVLPDPEDATLIDGNCFMRDSLRVRMIGDTATALSGDPERAEHVLPSLMMTRAYNGRMVTDLFTGKADFLATVVDHGVDVIIHESNLTYGITGKRANHVMLQLVPQEQGGSVRTNRQSIASFGDNLFAAKTPGRKHSRNIVFDAFTDEVTRELRKFKDGKPMSFVKAGAQYFEEDDDVFLARTIHTKALELFEATGDLNKSLGLQMQLATQRRDMWIPKGNVEKGRSRMPVPFAVRYSIRNVTSFIWVRGFDPQLKKGETFIDPEIGLIVADEDWAAVIDSLGGADLDDHVEIHFRIVTEDYTKCGVDFQIGDVAAFLIRNPIGLVAGKKDGVDVLASEFFVLRADSETASWAFERFGNLPTLAFTGDEVCRPIPAHVHEVEVDFATEDGEGMQPIKPEQPAEFTMKYFGNMCRAAASVQGVYDIHSASMRRIKLFDVTGWQPIAREDFFIDSCAQWRNPDQLVIIRTDNTRLSKLTDGMDVKETILWQFVAHHEQETRRFLTGARAHLKELQANLAAEFEGVEYVGPMRDGVPALVHWINITKEHTLKQLGVKERDLFNSEYEEMGTRIFRRVIALLDDPNVPDVTQDNLEIMFLDARAYYLATTMPSTLGERGIEVCVHNMFTPTDLPIMHGGLFRQMLNYI